jgi:hypothetical protein
MAKLQDLVARIQVITGVTKKRNRALQEIGELLEVMRGFQEKFEDPERVLADDNVVKARVDVSSLMYKIRNSEKIFRQLGNKQLTPLIIDVYDRLENVRVDVYNPHKGRVSLSDSLAGLRSSIDALEGAVSGIESG